MNETETSFDTLDLRRKRLRFRTWHRGMREVDLLLGRFADATIARLSNSELDSFEALLEVPDRDILAWITGEAPWPEEVDTPMFRRLVAFHGTVTEQNSD